MPRGCSSRPHQPAVSMGVHVTTPHGLLGREASGLTLGRTSMERPYHGRPMDAPQPMGRRRRPRPSTAPGWSTASRRRSACNARGPARSRRPNVRAVERRTAAGPRPGVRPPTRQPWPRRHQSAHALLKLQHDVEVGVRREGVVRTRRRARRRRPATPRPRRRWRRRTCSVQLPERAPSAAACRAVCSVFGGAPRPTPLSLDARLQCRLRPRGGRRPGVEFCSRSTRSAARRGGPGRTPRPPRSRARWRSCTVRCPPHGNAPTPIRTTALVGAKGACRSARRSGSRGAQSRRRWRAAAPARGARNTQPTDRRRACAWRRRASRRATTPPARPTAPGGAPPVCRRRGVGAPGGRAPGSNRPCARGRLMGARRGPGSAPRPRQPRQPRHPRCPRTTASRASRGPTRRRPSSGSEALQSRIALSATKATILMNSTYGCVRIGMFWHGSNASINDHCGLKSSNADERRVENVLCGAGAVGAHKRDAVL